MFEAGDIFNTPFSPLGWDGSEPTLAPVVPVWDNAAKTVSDAGTAIADTLPSANKILGGGVILIVILVLVLLLIGKVETL